MAKDKDKSADNHVRFTKETYRPYVRPFDLVTSDNFQKTVERAIKKREQRRESTEQRDA